MSLSTLFPKLTVDEIRDIELKTRGQSSNPYWHQVRKFGRLTASRFGDICLRKLPPTVTAINRILSTQNEISVPISPAAQFGLDSEDKACQMYLRKKFPGQKIMAYRTGFFLHKDFSFLGCSPDFICSDPVLNTYWIVEIKSFVARPNINDIYELINFKGNDFCCGINSYGELYLKHYHKFYYQIIGQMNIIGLEKCDLVLYYRDQVYIIEVKNNQYFWDKLMLPKLTAFMNNYIVPMLALDQLADKLSAIKLDDDDDEVEN
jgi:hypothetical protein